MRFVLTSLALVAGAFAADPAKPMPALTAVELSHPAGAGAFAVSLAHAPDGSVWLSWVERGRGTEMQLRFAAYDAAAKMWSTARTIAQGGDWSVDASDAPSLALGAGGRAMALWMTRAEHHAGARAMISQSLDAGKTWSRPAPLTKESMAMEFVSLAALADGRVLAAWLDGRAHQKSGRTQLFARIVGSSEADSLIDPSVCDCCPTTLTSFLDGSAVLAYRGRSSDEVRDIRVARFRQGAWSETRVLNHDEWRVAGCPVNGPALASDGGRVAAAWFTAADNDPRVLVSFSPDAGARFLMPLRLDTAKPAGRVDSLLLRDAAMLVSWVGADGAILVRRVSPEFTVSQSLTVAPAAAGRTKTWTRLALARDYTGDKEPAHIVVAFAQDGSEAGVRTFLLNVREGELVEAERDCDG
ncbi:MAG TPA: sialidase family protein, partial [Opitutaceae bacterium]|nr:sialidase family protein [Opitutaceae bacterium]